MFYIMKECDRYYVRAGSVEISYIDGEPDSVELIVDGKRVL